MDSWTRSSCRRAPTDRPDKPSSLPTPPLPSLEPLVKRRDNLQECGGQAKKQGECALARNVAAEAGIEVVSQHERTRAAGGLQHCLASRGVCSQPFPTGSWASGAARTPQ